MIPIKDPAPEILKRWHSWRSRNAADPRWAAAQAAGAWNVRHFARRRHVRKPESGAIVTFCGMEDKSAGKLQQRLRMPGEAAGLEDGRQTAVLLQQRGR